METEVETVDLQSQLENFLKSGTGRRWCLYEWFYSTIDRPYFQHNEFQDCLNEMGLANVCSENSRKILKKNIDY